MCLFGSVRFGNYCLLVVCGEGIGDWDPLYWYEQSLRSLCPSTVHSRCLLLRRSSCASSGEVEEGDSRHSESERGWSWGVV